MTDKIIVIDDEKSVCALFQKALEPEGYTVKTETDAVKRVELVRKEKPDCMLLDIKMPKRDGNDVYLKERG